MDAERQALPDQGSRAQFDWGRWMLAQVKTASTVQSARKTIERVMAEVVPMMAERDRLRAENERYRTVIKTALDTMAVANDSQLGPGGVARKAYAGLWHAYFAIPAGIESPPASDETEQTK